MKNPKDIVLGMPAYGLITAGAARGFHRAVDLPNRVWQLQTNSSLLCGNFNNLWCAALNLAAAGTPPTYFAMQHADVEPEDFWLDRLIEEIDATDLDILSVAIPIKNHQGLTSTALASDDGDPWKIHCRLTLEEVHRLPETFTSVDVGRPLLVNTGLWVCRFDPEWASMVRFETNDRIVFKDNKWQPETEPEDWHFSRQCHALGVKIGCTSKVRAHHVGSMHFGNDRVYGESFDAVHVNESVLGPVTEEAEIAGYI